MIQTIDCTGLIGALRKREASGLWRDLQTLEELLFAIFVSNRFATIQIASNLFWRLQAGF